MNRENLKLAFDTADKLGVPALMDPEDSMFFSSIAKEKKINNL